MKMYFIKKRSCSIFSSQVAVVKLHDQEQQSNERAWLTLSDLSLSEPEQGHKGRNLKLGFLLFYTALPLTNTLTSQPKS